MKTGNLSYKGELKQCNIVSNNGRIKLDLQNIEPSYKYEISGENGDIDITIPKENSINLVGASTEDANVQNGIKFDSSSTTFDINKTISRIKIHN